MKKSTARVVATLRVLLGAALMWYVITILGPTTLNRFQASTVAWIPIIALLPFFGAMAEAARLRVLFIAQDFRLRHFLIYRVALMGAFFNACIPGVTTGGDLMRIYFFASNRPEKTAEIIAVMLVDRAASLFALLTVVLALSVPNWELLTTHGTLSWFIWGAMAVMGALLVCAVLACSQFLHDHAWRHAILQRLPFGGFFERFTDALYLYRDHKRAVVLAWLISIPGHLVLAGLFIIAGIVFMPEAPPLVTAWASLIAMLANVLPLTPGGLGVGEIAFDRLFAILGYSGGASLQLAWRAAMLPIILTGGFLYALGKWKARPGLTGTGTNS
jgi:uncharacterized protein (TIRG00374 family)